MNTDDKRRKRREGNAPAEDKLRPSREDLIRAQALAHLGSWSVDGRRNQLLWSEENYRILGVPEGTPLSYETFLATVPTIAIRCYSASLGRS